MKTENIIILSSFALGLLVWLIDSLFDYFIFYEGTFTELLITDVPQHEVYIRVVILICFILFGFICSRLFAAQKKTEKKLANSLSFQEQLLETIPVPVFYKNDQFLFLGVNKSFEQLIGMERQDIIGKSVHDIVPPKLAELYQKKDSELIKKTGISIYEMEGENKNDTTGRHLIFHKATFTKPDGQVGGIIGAILDITERKKNEQQKEKLITKLQEALVKVKLLSGFLPICASCKKIRDDKGYWNQIESYIREHSEVEFSHGLCPDCAKKLYPGHVKNDLGK